MIYGRVRWLSADRTQEVGFLDAAAGLTRTRTARPRQSPDPRAPASSSRPSSARPAEATPGGR